MTEPSEPRVVAKPTVSPPETKLFPLASLSCTVMVELLEPSANIETGEAVINEVVASTGPGMKFTTALSMIAAAFTVPVAIAVPAEVDEVSVAVYVPSPLSVTDPREPRVVAKVTVSPPEVRLLLLASLNRTVIVLVDEPSAVIEPGAALIVDVVRSAGPGTKSTVALSVIAAALTVPVIVAVPVEVEEVSVAE